MQQCTAPLEVGMYRSHYDCATAGFIKGMAVIRELGEEYVNEKHMLMNFSCSEQENV